MKVTLYRIGLAAALLVLVTAWYFGMTTFFSRYHFMRASTVARTANEHEDELRTALKFDPSYGYANQAIARLLIRQAKYSAALDYQESGMESFRPVRAYQQLGSILTRLRRYEDAQQAFESALNMNPRDALTLEHLAALALERGNSNAVQKYTAQILQFDVNNLDVFYLRGRDAETKGSNDAAYANYQRIAASLSRNPDLSQGSLFSQDEIAERLQLLRPRSNK